MLTHSWAPPPVHPLGRTAQPKPSAAAQAASTSRLEVEGAPRVRHNPFLTDLNLSTVVSSQAATA